MRTATNRCWKRCADVRKDSVPTDAAKRTGNSPSLERKGASQGIDLSSEFKPEKLSQKTHLHFERVNEVTFKLTNAEATNVPASHGQWGGYRTTKAVAWVINIAPGEWLARCRNEASGPSSFNEAKANAIVMARGGPGDYFIENAIDHLNGLQAHRLNSGGEPE